MFPKRGGPCAVRGGCLDFVNLFRDWDSRACNKGKLGQQVDVLKPKDHPRRDMVVSQSKGTPR